MKIIVTLIPNKLSYQGYNKGLFLLTSNVVLDYDFE